MIEILQRKLAVVLNEGAHKALTRIDKNSPLAEELKHIDVEAVLKADIDKICRHLSLFEMTRVMGLMVQLNSEDKRHGMMKADLKRMVQGLIEKVEQKAGKLQIPMSCRDLFFNL